MGINLRLQLLQFRMLQGDFLLVIFRDSTGSSFWTI